MAVSMIYIDMDGVLADFDRGIIELCHIEKHDQEDQDDVKIDAMWDAVRRVPHFYDRLEPMPGALDMFDELKRISGGRVEILTGLPKPWRNIPDSAADKIKWARRYFSDSIKVNAVIREDKIKFCTGPSDILIDDLRSNINDWIQHGGTGILYHSPEQTIADIKDLAY